MKIPNQNQIRKMNPTEIIFWNYDFSVVEKEKSDLERFLALLECLLELVID